MFTFDERKAMIETSMAGTNIEVKCVSDNFLVTEAKRLGATHIVRGIRGPSDLEYESTVKHINEELDPSIQIIFLIMVSNHP